MRTLDDFNEEQLRNICRTLTGKRPPSGREAIKRRIVNWLWTIHKTEADMLRDFHLDKYEG